jgi:N-glycosylase/DNA lyase
LASARELKSATDEFRIEEFQKNSKKFTQLKKNYDVLIAAQKERVKRLNDFVDNLGIAVDFATVLDDAAKIAAGLAQSL